MYRCFNRPPPKTTTLVQDGWDSYLLGTSRLPRMVAIKVAGTTTCQYAATGYGKSDPQCKGCVWLKKSEVGK